jgi:signal transduction histidine kinase
MYRKIPFQIKISLVYIVLGALWILFSDRFVLSITNDPYLIHQISLYKGWFYVLITGVLLFVLVERDVRKRNQANLELAKSKKKAEESDRLKTAFLSNLSHYLRTPMNSILGFTQLLEESDMDEKKQQLFRSYIHEQSQHLLKTLNSIIEISKLQEGMVKPDNEKINLNELVNDIVDFLRIEVERSGKPIKVRVVKHFDNGPGFIFSDRGLVMRALRSMAINSVVFTQKGIVEFRCRTEGGYVVFSLIDSGTGVPVNVQKFLFHNYLYNTSATRSKAEGAGLSLYLSSELSSLLGGKLWLEKSSERGSEFCLKIPVELEKKGDCF